MAARVVQPAKIDDPLHARPRCGLKKVPGLEHLPLCKLLPRAASALHGMYEIVRDIHAPHGPPEPLWIKRVGPDISHVFGGAGALPVHPPPAHSYYVKPV